ncbi:MAG: transketolase [Acetobacteraceae bacterium]|jgi:transketolase|nr:transketolase [Acetobacteraceae bacterium]
MTDDVTGTVPFKDMANAIRALAMDAVETAKSGHPGMPMGMADVATVLWTRFLRFDPACPDWPDRDRFVLSAGHGSMLLYSLLHLAGYRGMDVAELRRFRQLGSRTPGHPEYGHTQGVETTTGPLGQGLGNAVGMALAERMLAARHGKDLVDHWTYVIAGDGCLMEGISHEAASLAGHLRLGRLTVLFDDNGISIDGPTSLAVSDDQCARFAAYGWHTQAIDGHDPDAITAAIETARADARPSLIACRTIIGFGAPNKQGTEATHGAPLGAAEIAAARERLGWPHAPFELPAAIREAWSAAGARGAALHRAWCARLAVAPADTQQAFLRGLRNDTSTISAVIRECKSRLAAEQPAWATRRASEEALKVLTEAVPELIGGSADLTNSNNTITPSTVAVRPGDFTGRYLHYGVREHAMAAAMNGIALHRGLIPYGGTFLVFSDYCRNAIRLSAMMGLRVVYVMTHDSIGLGEDGPTHQPVEHLASLRAMPNLLVFRPADAVETAECWEAALIEPAAPSLLALTRQALPTFRTEDTAENLCARGGYVLAEAEGGPRVITLLATGSEVQIAMAARARLQADRVPAAVVSLPCFELFERQDRAYRRRVLGDVPRLAVEAGSPFGWTRYVESEDDVLGLTGFGASAPAPDLYDHFGVTADSLVRMVQARLEARHHA